VELHYVELGPTEGNLRVIQAGLTAQDTYIVEGTQRARPGLPVRAEQKVAGAEDEAAQENQQEEEQVPTP